MILISDGRWVDAAAAILGGLDTQIKRWTFLGYLRDIKEGLIIIREEFLSIIAAFRNKSGDAFNRKDDYQDSGDRSSPQPPLNMPGLEFQSQASFQRNPPDIAEKDRPTSIVYGFSVLGKLWSLTLIYVPAFCVDCRLGLYPSRNFAIGTYAVGIISLIIGLPVANLVVEPTLVKVLSGLLINVYRLISIFVKFGEISYVVFGIFTMVYLTYWRKFVHRFLLYRCSIITLPRSFQRHQVISIFLITSAMAMCTEPLFAFLTLYQDIDQPNYWPQLTRIEFLMAKYLMIVGVVIGSMGISMLSTVFPVMTNFLIVMMANHLKNLLLKQMSRIKLAEPKSRRGPSSHPEALVDRQTRLIIADYSCDTLTTDWPNLSDDEENDEEDDSGDERDDGHDYAFNGNSNEHREAEEWETNDEVGNQIKSKGPTFSLLSNRSNNMLRIGQLSLEGFNPTGESQQYNSPLVLGSARVFHENGAINNKQSHGTTTGGVLFLYKNLIKSLSELKEIIEIYESKFGSFHLVLICISGLTVAQWIIAGLTEARLIQELYEREQLAKALAPNASLSSNDPRLDIDLSATAYATTFSFRVGVGVIMFILSNIFAFLRCDQLPSQMVKMRSRLFRLNVDLACSSIEQQTLLLPSRCPQFMTSHRNKLSNVPRATSWRAKLDAPHQTTNALIPEHLAEQNWQGLDQIWSLYDQVERMSYLANFRLTTSTYYSKNCLLMIFGREVSLVLLYIQIIDIYSYA